MKAVSLNAFPRTQTRRKGTKQLRGGGRVPAIIYGRYAKPQNLELNSKEIEDLLHHSASEAILVDLAVTGDAEPKRLALVQDVQHHPLSGHVLHVDFHQVREDERVTVALSVESVGEAAGVKNSGGVLEHVLFKVKVRGLAKDLPEVITVDVAHLEIGQAVHLGELKLPAGCEAIGDKGIPVIAVAAPVSEAQEQAALDAATAPLADAEMLKEKKEEGEGAEAKPGEKPAAGAKAGDKAAAGAKPGEKAPAAGAKPAEKAPEKKK